MTSHVDAETLALSAEGLLDDEEERSVRTHVAGCSQCADIQAALGDVPRLLAETPVPPLPESVTGRLDEAIRAERANPAPGGGTPSAAGEDDGSTGSDDRSAQEPGGTVDGDAAEELRSRAAEVVPMRRRGMARWMPYIAAAAAAVFVFGGGAALLRGMGDDGAGQGGPTSLGTGEPHAIKPYSPEFVESGTGYTAAGLEEQAGEVLSLAVPESASGSPEGDGEGTGTSSLPSPAEVPADVSSCVEGMGDPSPVLVDIATYAPEDGSAEAAWVMYTDDGSGSYTVSVVSPECTSGDPADAVLDSATVAGP